MAWISWLWTHLPTWIQFLLILVAVAIIVVMVLEFWTLLINTNRDTNRIINILVDLQHGNSEDDDDHDDFDDDDGDEEGHFLETEETELELEVLAAFNNDPILCGRSIDIMDLSWRGDNVGVVDLTGTVDSAEERDLAERIAREVPGVNDVINRLGVSRQAEAVIESEEEAESRKFREDLDDKVFSALSEVPDLYNEVNIQANNDGSVELNGFVGSTEELHSAEKIVSEVEGVTSVINYLAVRDDTRPDDEDTDSSPIPGMESLDQEFLQEKRQTISPDQSTTNEC